MKNKVYGVNILGSEEMVYKESPWLLCDYGKSEKKKKSKKKKSKKKKKDSKKNSKKKKIKNMNERLIEKTTDVVLDTASDICIMYFDRKWK